MYQNINKSWINFAKVAAMGGVIIQHVKGYAYNSNYIFYSVWWVVALFIMIGGYNAYNSYKNRGYVIVRKRISTLLCSYFWATIIYVYYNTHYIDAIYILKKLISFSASGPLYYIAVYLQLVLVTPVIIAIVESFKKNVVLSNIFFFLAVLIVCRFTIKHSNIFDIIIGGGNLFAGPWLMFWCLGILFAKFERVEHSIQFRIMCFFINSILIVLWQYYFINKDVNLSLRPIFHGEQVRMTWANAIETVLLFFWFKDSIFFLEKSCGILGKKLLQPFDYMGKHTLYIFIYHMLFLYIYQRYFEISFCNGLFCVLFMFISPLIFEVIFSKVKICFYDLIGTVKII